MGFVIAIARGDEHHLDIADVVGSSPIAPATFPFNSTAAASRGCMVPGARDLGPVPAPIWTSTAVLVVYRWLASVRSLKSRDTGCVPEGAGAGRIERHHPEDVGGFEQPRVAEALRDLRALLRVRGAEVRVEATVRIAVEAAHRRARRGPIAPRPGAEGVAGAGPPRMHAPIEAGDLPRVVRDELVVETRVVELDDRDLRVRAGARPDAGDREQRAQVRGHARDSGNDWRDGLFARSGCAVSPRPHRASRARSRRASTVPAGAAVQIRDKRGHRDAARPASPQ